MLRSQARKFFDAVVVHGWLQVVGSRMRVAVNLMDDGDTKAADTKHKFMGLFKKKSQQEYSRPLSI